MKKLALTMLAVLSAGSALAGVNQWESDGPHQGFISDIISNNKGQTFSLTCNSGGYFDFDHHINFYATQKANDEGVELKTKQYKIVINGQAYQPRLLATRTVEGAKRWDAFSRALSKAKSFEIHKNGTKIAEFKPKKVLNSQCDSMRGYIKSLDNDPDLYLDKSNYAPL